MNTNELFEYLTKEPKWYGGKITRQLASSIVKRHKSGKYNNYEWFFSLFGHYVVNGVVWNKPKES